MTEEISSQPNETKTQTSEPVKKKEWYTSCWGIIIVILILPFFLIWFIWAKTKWKTLWKVLSTVAIALIIVIIAVSGSKNTNKAPVITLTSPDNNATIQALEVEVKGKVDPTTSTLKINDKGIHYNNDGTFDEKVSLNEGKNTIKVVATYGSQTTEVDREVTVKTKVKKALSDIVGSDNIEKVGIENSDTSLGEPSGMKDIFLTYKTKAAGKTTFLHECTNIFHNEFNADNSIYLVCLTPRGEATDNYGKTTLSDWAFVKMSRPTNDKIDYTNFDWTKLPTIADQYTEKVKID